MRKCEDLKELPDRSLISLKEKSRGTPSNEVCSMYSTGMLVFLVCGERKFLFMIFRVK